ncbi:MAG: hypothetical protein LQ350_004740 [Teloschistes chrysophthalmus]|nr:MAG: hypothetical protein LQ350_004740 [Niorma chrysophthalma]
MGSEEGLIFVNLSKPEDLKAADRRKLVRSQAAKDHSQSSSSICKPVTPKPRRHRKLLTAEYNLDLDGTKLSGTFALQADREPSTPTQSHSLPPGNGEQKLNGKQTSEKADSPGPLVLRSMSDLSAMAVDIPELDHPGQKGLLRSIWSSMVIANQATLDVVVLTAATHYIMVDGSLCEPEILYKLKEDAIASINRAL